MRTRVRALAQAVVAGAAFWTASVAACGYCIEDRIATVYEQAAIDQALSRRQAVVFFSIEGDPAADAATRRAVLDALEAGGGVRGSARIALETAACSVTFDPRRTRLPSLVAAADRSLAARGLTLKPLQVIDRAGKMEAP